jgi:hypothetical protein
MKGAVYARKEPNRWAARGFIYLYIYEITDEHGNLLATDNTGSWRKIYDACHQNTGALRKAQHIGAIRRIEHAAVIREHNRRAAA